MWSRYLRRQVRAYSYAFLVEHALRSQPFELAVRQLGLLKPGEKSPILPLDQPEIYAVARAVKRVYRYTPLLPDTCLRRALTIGAMLRHFAPALRVGVKRPLTVLDAHAWLEFGDLVVDVNRTPSSGYSTLKKQP